MSEIRTGNEQKVRGRIRFWAGYIAGLAVASTIGYLDTSTTTEGTATQTCVEQSTDYILGLDDKVYLGDLSSDDSPFNGRHEDWAYFENSDGQIRYEKSSEDNGVFEDLETGFSYVENGIEYRVSFNNQPSLDIHVNLQTNCNPEVLEGGQ